MLLRRLVALCAPLLVIPAFSGTIEVNRLDSVSIEGAPRPGVPLPFSLNFAGPDVPAIDRLIGASLDLDLSGVSVPSPGSARPLNPGAYLGYDLVGYHQEPCSYACGSGTCTGSRTLPTYAWFTHDRFTHDRLSYDTHGGTAPFSTAYVRVFAAGSTSPSTSGGAIPLLASGFAPSLSGGVPLNLDDAVAPHVNAALPDTGCRADPPYAVASALPPIASSGPPGTHGNPAPAPWLLFAAGLLALWCLVIVHAQVEQKNQLLSSETLAPL